MKMSELKQKLYKYELAKIGFPNAVYIPESDKIKINSDNERMPFINDIGDIHYGSEYRNMVSNIIEPLAKRVNEICSEWEKAKAAPFKDLSNYKIFADYNGTVLAARNDTEQGRGFHFVTWDYAADRKGFVHGHYSDDYEYIKEDFVKRAGLIEPNKVITKEQAVVILSAIDYRISNDELLTFNQEERLKSIKEKIIFAYSELSETETENINSINVLPDENFNGDYPHIIETDEKSDDNTPDASLQDKILDRVEKNFNDFRADTLAKGEVAVFDMAYKISMYDDVVSFFEYRAYNLKSEDIEYLLQYQNPLKIIVDELYESGKDDLSRLDNYITDFCKRRDIGNGYPLMNEKEEKNAEINENEKPSLLGRVQENKKKSKSNKTASEKKNDIEI